MIYYEDEKLSLIVDIICFIFSFLSIFIISELINEYFNNNFDFLILLITSFLCLFGGIVFGYMGLKNIISVNYNRKLANNIKKKGNKVKGNICSIETEMNYDYKKSIFKRASFFRRKDISLGDGRDMSYYHYAIVHYTYNKKEYTINTPYLDFYPDDLKDKNVDVYIYNNMCYVDNFNIKKEEIIENNEKLKKRNLLIVTMFLVLFLILSIIVYLGISNVITNDLMDLLIIVVMIMCFIIAIIMWMRSM